MLYKKTRLEDTFSVNMLAVADRKPETLNLKQVIEHHVDFQFEVTRKKYQTLLNKETERREVQEGLIKACDVIDLIIEILPGKQDSEAGARLPDRWRDGGHPVQNERKPEAGCPAALYRAPDNGDPGDASPETHRTGDRGAEERI